MPHRPQVEHPPLFAGGGNLLYAMKRMLPRFHVRTGSAIPWLLPLLLSAVLISSCGWFRDEAPEPLIDVWVTDEARYAGASLEITEKLVVFNTIDGQTYVNFITDIEKTEEKGLTFYDIMYKDRKGLEYTLSVSLRQQGRKKILQFRNQTNMEWRPKSEEE